ncbi:MAG TPA: PEP-CTERM sorting domain-containing protein [Accumulibacter sp.]|nr:PEP-CTERM sorting domain-containing protein [Accumulibacter sp.]HMW18752.1 PEP-CTERM sorting domain-containing protein [Accumulibacter sp.]HMX22567.1 PEP-CTERM sorting domain-containing protein [Accumulibacter sp.]HMY06098.1 PEP-CTERM sorting domain-containing protein [Accumulibacter sp.]HNC18778.1 PEP-CTERM sorting domain-containing protein [Accumulibacter sp.]
MKLPLILPKLSSGLLLSCSLLAAANVSAAVIVERLPTTAATGIQADNSSGPPYTEMVSLSATTIDRFTWWGYYLGGGTADDLFVAQFDGTSLVGSVTSFADGQVDGIDLYRYELELAAPYIFGGGADLQIDLINDSLDVQWFWQGADAPVGSNIAPRALSLAQNDVPEPGMLALLAISGMSLLFLSRYRSRSRVSQRAV